MAKHCETFDHTADVGLAAEGDTLAELFEALAEGLADYICPRAQVVPRQTRRIHVRSEDVEALAVDFLCEVMVALESDKFAIASVKVTDANDSAVSAGLAGEPVDPARHEFHTEVKAVTYHRLSVRQADGRWTGRVILDI
jgi:SHS2 domain-containing protein